MLSARYNVDTTEPDELDDDALLAELGVEAETASITELKHVRSSKEKRAAEQIANRTPCEDFEQFKPLFDRVKQVLDSGVRVSGVIRKDASFLKTDIKTGEFFILGGQTLYVAEVGEYFKAPNGALDARLRVIYSNGTESDILLRSLQRAIYKDETSRRISEPNAGPSLPMSLRMKILQAGKFTYYEANQITRLSRRTEKSCTRLVSRAGRLNAV